MRAVEARLAERMESPVGAIPAGRRPSARRGRQAAAPAAGGAGARAPPTRRWSCGVAVGCAAELIHTATLYHDDVVDDGRVRRGRPAARMVFGNGIVVLVGDFCLARALETVALTGLAARGAVAGGDRDRDGRGRGRAAGARRQPRRHRRRLLPGDRSQDRVADRLVHARGRRRGRGATTGALERYGRALGRAFQIADDVLDSDVDEATAGKSVGHDLTEGKLTLPVLLACEADPALARFVRSHLGEQRRAGRAGRRDPAARARSGRRRARAAQGARAGRRRPSPSWTCCLTRPTADALRDLAVVRRRSEIVMHVAARRARRRRRCRRGDRRCAGARSRASRQPARLRAPAGRARRAAPDRPRGRSRPRGHRNRAAGRCAPAGRRCSSSE